MSYLTLWKTEIHSWKWVRSVKLSLSFLYFPIRDYSHVSIGYQWRGLFSD